MNYWKNHNKWWKSGFLIYAKLIVGLLLIVRMVEIPEMPFELSPMPHQQNPIELKINGRTVKLTKLFIALLEERLTGAWKINHIVTS